MFDINWHLPADIIAARNGLVELVDILPALAHTMINTGTVILINWYLPAAIVSARIGLVELVAVVSVPAHVEDRNTEGSLATRLGVGLQKHYNWIQI
jgi:hypothetical protein